MDFNKTLFPILIIVISCVLTAELITFLRPQEYKGSAEFYMEQVYFDPSPPITALHETPIPSPHYINSSSYFESYFLSSDRVFNNIYHQSELKRNYLDFHENLILYGHLNLPFLTIQYKDNSRRSVLDVLEKSPSILSKALTQDDKASCERSLAFLNTEIAKTKNSLLEQIAKRSDIESFFHISNPEISAKLIQEDLLTYENIVNQRKAEADFLQSTVNYALSALDCSSFTDLLRKTMVSTDKDLLNIRTSLDKTIKEQALTLIRLTTEHPQSKHLDQKRKTLEQLLEKSLSQKDNRVNNRQKALTYPFLKGEKLQLASDTIQEAFLLDGINKEIYFFQVLIAQKELGISNISHVKLETLLEKTDIDVQKRKLLYLQAKHQQETLKHYYYQIGTPLKMTKAPYIVQLAPNFWGTFFYAGALAILTCIIFLRLNNKKSAQ